MKMNCIINPATVVKRFGHACLIKRVDGEYELVGGGEGDYTKAKEWVSLFAHEIVFSRPMKRRQSSALHAVSRSKLLDIRRYRNVFLEMSRRLPQLRF
jgi:hypothetical protein